MPLRFSFFLTALVVEVGPTGDMPSSPSVPVVDFFDLRPWGQIKVGITQQEVLSPSVGNPFLPLVLIPPPLVNLPA